MREHLPAMNARRCELREEDKRYTTGIVKDAKPIIEILSPWCMYV
jgi:hypothetical protein